MKLKKLALTTIIAATILANTVQNIYGQNKEKFFGNSPLPAEKELGIDIYGCVGDGSLLEMFSAGYAIYNPDLTWDRITQSNWINIKNGENLTDIAKSYGMKTDKEINTFIQELYTLNPRLEKRADYNQDGLADQVFAGEIIFINKKYQQPTSKEAQLQYSEGSLL